MIAHRFRGRNPSVPTSLAETGHRHADPPVRPDPPPRPMRNGERIAADRQKISDGGVLDILLAHVRGNKELSPSQVSTAFGLLRKILPDFAGSAAPREAEEEQSPSGIEVHIVDPKDHTQA
jgi:hypothetical protein